jgi:hypothetical protein
MISKERRQKDEKDVSPKHSHIFEKLGTWASLWRAFKFRFPAW